MKKHGDQVEGVQVLDIEALTETGSRAPAPGGVRPSHHAFGSSSAWGSSDDSLYSGSGCKGVTIAVQGLAFRAQIASSCIAAAGARGGRQVLKGVTCCFSPGTFSVITGPTGSGKRTLLDLLAGRKSQQPADGSVLFSGAAPTRAYLRRHTAYVERDDTLIPRLTVEDMISYTAELKLPLGEGAAAKRAAVEDVIKKLGLEGCRDRVIGDALHTGISRGEARRVSIAIQLIGRPSVLFMDEPTCGLDVFSANKVIAVARSLALDGAAVIAALERPTDLAFAGADSLMVLLRGHVAYWGPSGAPALEYAASLNLPAAKGARSAVHGVEWLCELYGSAAADEEQAASLAAACQRTPSTSGSNSMLDAQQACCQGAAAPRAVGAWGGTAVPWWWALLTLLRYRGMRRFTNLAWLTAHIPDKLLIALVLGAVYFGMAGDVTIMTSLQVSSLLFLWSAIALWLSVAFLPTILSERRLFVRERDDGLYRTSTYLAAQLVEDIVVATPATVAAAALVFSLCKVQGTFAVFWLAYWSAVCCGIAMAHSVAAWSPSLDIACAWQPLIIAVLLFFAGFLVPFRDLPRWLAWICWVNPLRYTWVAVMVNQFGGSRTKFVTGQPVLAYFSIADEQPLVNIGIVWAFTAAAALAAWAGLHVRCHFWRR